MTSCTIPDLPNAISDTNIYNYMFYGSLNLNTIRINSMECPQALISSTGSFGRNNTSYVGYNTRMMGVNKLIVPVGATGYDDLITVHPELTDPTKCGFTIQYGE